MVLEHISNRTIIVIVGGAVVYPQGFRYCYLDIVDITVVPERFKNHICKTQGHQILDGFLAKIMINPVHLIFPEYREQFIIDFP